MIFLATDFGLEGPYTGQLKAGLTREAPDVPVIDLFADLPTFQAQYAAYLLASYANALAAGDVLLAVVDPGVGGDRRPLMIHADGCIFVGPDNGLFELVRRRATDVSCFAITWEPVRLSASFHGRDLFAPVAARLAQGQSVPGEPCTLAAHLHWPDDLASIIYVDRYGNAMTGLRASGLHVGTTLETSGMQLRRARTFGDREPGEAFWYENANGLAEIAVNRGSAASDLGLRPGSKIKVHSPR